MSAIRGFQTSGCASPIIFSHDKGKPVRFTGRSMRRGRFWKLEPGKAQAYLGPFRKGYVMNVKQPKLYAVCVYIYIDHIYIYIYYACICMQVFIYIYSITYNL
jgi:hypothetical protein